jgi:hypothetical protein
MRGHLKRYVLAFGFVLVASSLALAAFKFQKIDRSGSVDTLPSGINDAGWIVGTSETAAQVMTNTEEGFLLREGSYKTITYPPPMGAVPHSNLGGINNQGEIVGTWDDPTNDHCFLWKKEEDGQEKYKSFDVSLTNNVYPDCNGINAGGDTVGSYVDTTVFNNHGWLRRANGTFSPVDVPSTMGSNTEAYGINKYRDIVGLYQDALFRDHGFLRHNGVYSTIDFPGLLMPDTNALGINDEGDIVGSYTDTKDHGFLMRDGEYKTVDVPYTGAETNKVTGINNRGCMVGVYTYTSGLPDNHEHGFKAGLRQADVDGEEAGKNGGPAYMHVHEDDCIEQPDREDYSDSNSRTDFRSTQVTAVTYDNVAHSVTIAGLGTNNGVPVTFTIIAVDSALVPQGIFSIILSDGYSNTGSLLTGAITLH